MEIFFSKDIDNGICRLEGDEAAHCVKVLRHKAGDEICIIDGEGTFYSCTIISAAPREVTASIVSIIPDWGDHPYRLTMGVCPTKNIDRYEWFLEKGTEFGLDRVVPTVGEHSERKTIKKERLEKILLSASKQSLKGAVPEIADCVSVRDFVESCRDSKALKLIAYCFDDEKIPKRTIKEILDTSELSGDKAEIIILIGPEGDFSRKEAEEALRCGFIPTSLGPSRLRTETAALAAVSAVYYRFL